MDCLVGYGSDDENETDRYHGHYSGSSHAAGSSRRRDDDTNYDDVNMDMSEDSQAESEPELPPAEPPRPTRPQREDRRPSNDSRDRDFERRGRRESPHRPDRPDHTNRPDRFDRTDRPDRPDRRDRDQRDRRDDRYRSERDRGRHEGGSRRGLLGDKPDGRPGDKAGAAPEPCSPRRSADARDAVSPRFRDERERERGRDRDRHARREDARSGRRDRERSRSRGAAYPPPAAHASGSSERRGSPSGDYRPSSYKVNRKLEVMEKMGLQIKTPDGSMATAAQLRLAASEAPAGPGLPAYCHPGAASTSRVLDQVQKRKLLWSNKNKSEAEEAAKWSGTRFAQDNDGRQVSKFMRLMGIKDQAAVKPEPADKNVDPIKKQEELFQAMQAQYEVARATTHTMRGVGLGFQRSQF